MRHEAGGGDVSPDYYQLADCALNSRGVLPVYFLKVDVKYDDDEKPHERAMSVMESRLDSSIRLALAMRQRMSQSIGVIPAMEAKRENRRVRL